MVFDQADAGPKSFGEGANDAIDCHAGAGRRAELRLAPVFLQKGDNLPAIDAGIDLFRHFRFTGRLHLGTIAQNNRIVQIYSVKTSKERQTQIDRLRRDLLAWYDASGRARLPTVTWWKSKVYGA